MHLRSVREQDELEDEEKNAVTKNLGKNCACAFLNKTEWYEFWERRVGNILMSENDTIVKSTIRTKSPTITAQPIRFHSYFMTAWHESVIRRSDESWPCDFQRRTTSSMCLNLFSRIILVYHCKCCVLIGYSSRLRLE